MYFLKFNFFFQTDASQYLDTLRPKYNSVDLTEVELTELEVNKPYGNGNDKEDEDTNMLLDVRIKMLENKFISKFFYFFFA